MTPAEINRFMRTFDNLEQRRNAYKWPIDNTDSIIALIKDAIVSGNNRTIDILKHVRRYMPMDESFTRNTLIEGIDTLWTFTRGTKTTKHYHLIESHEA